jgi:activator of HSP90 ATPase
MSKTITYRIVFKNTTPKSLYELYINPKKHSLVTGAPANISSKIGTKFSAHSNYISGRNLQLVKDKLIVQSWRASSWSKQDVDSTFIIYLERKGKDVILNSIHANVPDKHVKGIQKGWHQHYWKTWKQYLAGKPIKRAAGM